MEAPALLGNQRTNVSPLARSPSRAKLEGLADCECRPNNGSPALYVLSLRYHAVCRTRARRSGKPARPYMVRFIILSRLIWPSAGLVVHGRSRAACTAAKSRFRLAANASSRVPTASASTFSKVSVLFRRNNWLSRLASAMAFASWGAWSSKAAMKVCSGSVSLSSSAMSMRATWRIDGDGPLMAGVPVAPLIDCGSALRHWPVHLRTIPDRPVKPSSTSSRQSRAAL